MQCNDIGDDKNKMWKLMYAKKRYMHANFSTQKIFI